MANRNQGLRVAFAAVACVGMSACGAPSSEQGDTDTAAIDPAAPAVGAVAETLSGAFKPRGSNSQVSVPNDIVLGDYDRDGKTDFLQYYANKLFITHTDFNQTRVLSYAVPATIKRVITGDFYNVGGDHVCAIMTNGTTACYGISPDHTTLWWAFNQGTFIADNEDFIVGDFNADGKDDILVYSQTGGAYRMYTLGSNGFFGAMPSFNQGNLSSVVGSGYKVRAGDFNGDGRQDVAIVRPDGTLSYFGSVHSGSTDTFWWSFNTAAGFVGSSDQLTIARINNDAKDDVVLRNTTSGATRFYQMAQSGSGLAAVTGVSQGQLDVEGNSQVFWGSMHDVSASEPGSNTREDALVYLKGTNQFVRDDGRWDGSTYTYWWDYTQHSPINVLHATAQLGGPNVYANVPMTLDAFGSFTMTPAIENHDQLTGFTYNITCNIGTESVGYQGHVGPEGIFNATGPGRDNPGTIGVVDTAGIPAQWSKLVGLWQAGPQQSPAFGCKLDESSTLGQEVASIEQIIANVALQYLGLDPDGIANMTNCLTTSSNKFVCGQDPRQCVQSGTPDEGGSLDCDPDSFPGD
jgi:hypothetical protein